jgi:hypothetical protein
MAFLTIDQQRERMDADGVRPWPILGAGTVDDPFRETDGRAPSRSAGRERRALQEYVATWDDAYRAAIADLAAGCRPLADDCRAVVLLPARNEKHTLAQTLRYLLDQRDPVTGTPLPAGRYEVQLLLNRFSHEAADADLVALAALPNADRLSTVEYVHADDEHAPLTRARKVSADLAVYRALARPRYAAPLYFVSQDADMLWVDPREVAWYVDRFDREPGLDAIRGQQDRCPWILVKHPLVLLMRRSWNFCESLLTARSQHPDRNPHYDFNWNRTITSGWSTGFTAEVYALIRGYTPDRRFEEDMDIGERISCLRGIQVPGRGFVPQVQTTGRCPLRSEGSPRRWLYWAATSVQPYDDGRDYSNFFDLSIERDVKDLPLDELDAAVRPYTGLVTEPVTGAFQTDFDFLTATVKDRALAMRWYARVLSGIGFAAGDVAIDDGRVQVRNLDRAEAAISSLAARLRGLRPPSQYPAGGWPTPPAGSTWRAFAEPAR